MVQALLPLIPPHRVYVEPFAGAASLFWAKEPSELEVLNDLDPDLMRFYRHLGEITHCNIGSLGQHPNRLAAKAGVLEPCEFLADVSCSYRKKRFENDSSLVGLNSSHCTGNRPLFHKRLPFYQARIQKAQLHNEDWEIVTRRYDASDAFMFFDPPYHEVSPEYTFSQSPLLRLAQVLPTLRSKWLLTFNDHPEVRAAFAKYSQRKIETLYSISASGPTRGHQLIIRNF